MAFSYCYWLTEVTIPNSVTAIGGSAFPGCSGLKSISIPNSVTAIGDSAFSGCSGLTSIVVESDNTIYDSRNNCNAIIESYINSLIVGYENTYIPNSVTEIGFGAFSGCYLESVTSYCETPPACEDYAFEGSYSARLNVPEGTKEAYANADEWRNFTNINENSGVNGIETADNASEVARYDIHGRLLGKPTEGINIVKYNDGTTKKVIMKN